MLPVLRLMAEGRGSVKDCLPHLVREFSVSGEEQAVLIPSGRMSVLASRTHWARTYLSKAGLLRSPRRGLHEVTDLGRETLSSAPPAIDNAFLEQFESFRAWRASREGGERKTATQGSDVGGADRVSPASDATPDERLAAAAREIDAALADDVLAAALETSPARFERLIVELLIAMGYGRGDPTNGRATRFSADGGIDGVVNDDPLGLDAVYIQAKRYAPENRIGRPAIQAFVGAMQGEGASKGVFVTTSAFSREARDYVRTVAQRIVLIDGARLARLMIAHGVGVRTRRVVELRDIDEAFFQDA
ncbi:MAG: restriction endonuclease [Pseudomonadota bacterium]